MSAQFNYTIDDLVKYIRESISGNCDEPGYGYLKYISGLSDNDKKIVYFIAEKASEFIVRHISNITTKQVPIEDYVGGVYSFTRASDGNIEVNFIVSNEDPQFQGKLDYWLGRVRKFDNLLNSYLQGNAVYKFERAEDGEVIATELMNQYDLKELTKACENLEKVWRRNDFIEHSLPFRIRQLLTIIDRKSSRNLEKLKLFQEDVIVYLRAIIITASALGDDCVTHKEKNTLLKGLTRQIETSIRKVKDNQNNFIANEWESHPDLFASDYPIRAYLERIKDLENQIERLKKGESATEDDNF